MARTANLTLPVASYTQTYTFIPITTSTFGITFNYALSAETASIPSLSGDNNYTFMILSGTLLPNTDIVSFSASPTSIVLRYPGNRGNQDFYGLITTSTMVSATSAWTATIDFNDFMLNNTIIPLSGNKTTSIIQSTAVIENVAVDTGVPVYSVWSGLSSNNISIRTMAEHCRRWNLN